jgi:glutamate-1-semialdehyde aminotransferase
MCIRDRYITKIIDELNLKCQRSKEHNERYREPFANYRAVAGYSSALKPLMFTLVINHSKGAHFTDIDGNRYLDITMGFGVHFFGHSPAFINDIIKSKLEHGYSLGPLYEDPAECAKLIKELTNVERCAFFNSGTEAVMVAMRLVKAATTKNKIVIFSGSYHGTFDSLLSIRSNSKTRQAEPHVPGITKNILADTIILKYGSEESLDFIKKHKNSIAGVLTEPVQSRNPGFRPQQFISDLRNICTEGEIMLIFDEIITGFRYSNRGAMGYYNVQADIVTYGKTIGGGMPIGIVAGKAAIMDFIDGGQWSFKTESEPLSKTTFVAGTFCHHPITMAVAKKAIETFQKDESIQADLNQTTDKLCSDLNAFFYHNSIPIHIENFGSQFYFKLKGNARFLFYGLLNEGVYIWEGRTCFLSTAHTLADINFLIEKIKKVCFDLKEAGMF